jgi:hypothetical protein
MQAQRFYDSKYFCPNRGFFSDEFETESFSPYFRTFEMYIIYYGRTTETNNIGLFDTIPKYNSTSIDLINSNLDHQSSYLYSPGTNSWYNREPIQGILQVLFNLILGLMGIISENLGILIDSVIRSGFHDPAEILSYFAIRVIMQSTTKLYLELPSWVSIPLSNYINQSLNQQWLFQAIKTKLNDNFSNTSMWIILIAIVIITLLYI